MVKNRFLYLWDDENPSGYKNRMGFYKTKHELDFILHSLTKDPLTILDIGGGTGRFALPLCKLGYKVTNIDIDPIAVELSKMKGIEESYCINLEDFEGSGYDAVLAIEIFLVTKPELLMSKANQLLKGNGILIFVGSNTWSWRFYLHKLRKNRSPSYHLNLLQYKELIQKYGFEICRIKGFHWLPFRVNSNNILIPFFEKIEKLFRLDHFLAQSPWLLFSCKKTKCI